MYDLPPQPSTSLEDVIGNMKDTLKAIRNDVNHKTLKDLNREMTPFDLPALSPVPQVESFTWPSSSTRCIVLSLIVKSHSLRRLWRGGPLPTVLARR